MKRIVIGFFLMIVLLLTTAFATEGYSENQLNDYEIILSEGCNGDEVLKMKKRMQELGYFTAGASLSDAYNGTCVERVKQFQEKNGLVANGIADNETLSLLYSDHAKDKNFIHYDITETEKLLYANVLDTVNSLKQIHVNPDTIDLLGAVVMNPNSDTPRTVVYISSKGMNNKKNTDYFWKDLYGSEISTKFAKDCYSGHNGRMPIEKLDLMEIGYYATYGDYIPDLSSTRDIVVDY